MPLFWIFICVSMVVIGGMFGALLYMARDAGGEGEKPTYRMRPDHLRILAYAIMILICFAATMYELHVMYSE